MDLQNQGGSSQGGDMPQRPMYKVNAKCADCGADITELPFQPDPARMSQLRCRNCYKPRRNNFRGGPRN